MNFVTGGKVLLRMPRGKKQKSPEEEQELLEDLYTNRNFSGTTYYTQLVALLLFDTVHFLLDYPLAFSLGDPELESHPEIYRVGKILIFELFDFQPLQPKL